METDALFVDFARILFAGILCFSVPFATLYSLIALGSAGFMLGVVPLGGAVWLIATARWPSGTRFAVAFVAVAGAIAWSAVVISQVFAAWSS